jgi:Xaa-Pro aminopeptidase
VAQAIMETAVKPGVTEADAVAAGVDVATKNLINVYDVAVASGPNSMKYSHGRLPSWTDRTLEKGDFFHIDTYGAHEGYLYDFSRTVLVGGKPSKEQEEILEAAIDAIEAGIEAIRPGVKGKDVYAAVRKVLDDRDMTGDGFMGELDNTPALTSAFPGHGHSIGLFWEAPWLFEDEELTVPANSCYGIECAAGREGVGSAMFEQDVIVTEEGTELITKTDKRFW